MDNYSISDSFNLSQALMGIPVTLADSLLDSDDISRTTGILRQSGTADVYTTVINNTTYRCLSSGYLLNSDGSISSQHFKMVTTKILPTYGTNMSMTRGADTGWSDKADLSLMEPRDEFAIRALNAMISNLDHPETVNDATMMLYARASYRWAQAMMVAAADAREQVKEKEDPIEPTTRVDVELTGSSTSEKLLYNLVESVDDLTKKVETSGTVKRDDFNDTGLAVTDFIVYNSDAGKTPLRATLANVITKAVASLSQSDKAALHTALKPLFDDDYQPLPTT